MSPEATLMTAIAVSLGIFYAARWIARMPVDPDPWDGQLDDEEGMEEAEEEASEHPVCSKCLAPVASASQHYCQGCGNAIGEFTPYVPFVNIRFNCSLFATLWHKLKDPEVPIVHKFIPAVVLLLFAPLLAGIPYLFYWLPLLVYEWLVSEPDE
ncbi:MAG: hypothetical protein HN849_33210 [Victivallales bacterium]|jgi:hypothetical protein|nr:hypothetical protein [Victivallales bacterium]